MSSFFTSADSTTTTDDILSTMAWTRCHQQPPGFILLQIGTHRLKKLGEIQTLLFSFQLYKFSCEPCQNQEKTVAWCKGKLVFQPPFFQGKCFGACRILLLPHYKGYRGWSYTLNITALGHQTNTHSAWAKETFPLLIITAGWWLRNLVNSPVELGSWNPIIYKSCTVDR